MRQHKKGKRETHGKKRETNLGKNRHLRNF
jgi:hypothetical protein